MLALIATLKIDPANAARFEAEFTEVAAKVRADEPGNIAYNLTRSRTEPGTYRVMEIYRDDEALRAHSGSEHFKAFRPTMAELLVAPPEMEKLDVVV